MSTQETLDALADAQKKPANNLFKSYSEATGLVNYDLQRPAKLMYPVLTPLRNMINRRPAQGGTATNWKAITAINTNGMYAGVSEGNRGGIIGSTVLNKVAPFAGLGLENYVTFEADYAAKNFDDVRALAVTEELQSLMIEEEKIILGGNFDQPLGLTGTPQTFVYTTGGTLGGSQTISVGCIGLTLDGYTHASVAGGVPASVTRVNADGSTDTFGGGSARKSSTTSATIPGGTSTNSVSAVVGAQTGAVAYAWFWGPSGSEVLGAITTINSVLITANATGTQTLASIPNTDNSVNQLYFDGIMTQILTAGSNSYVYTMPAGVNGKGTPLTSDGAAGIVEFEAAFASFWTNYKTTPTMILVSAQELVAINKLVIGNGGAPLIRFNIDEAGKGLSDRTLTAGSVVGAYMNKLGMSGGSLVKIVLHPNVPPGTVIFYCDRLNYSLSNVSRPIEMVVRQEYYQREWPLRTRKYEYGVYCDETLAIYFPPAFGMINNIGTG